MTTLAPALALALLALPSAARADSSAPSCASNADCAVIAGVCPESWEAVPKADAAARAHATAQMKPPADCKVPRPGGPDPKPDAVCLQGTCSLVRKTTVNTRDVHSMVKGRHRAPIAVPAMLVPPSPTLSN